MRVRDIVGLLAVACGVGGAVAQTLPGDEGGGAAPAVVKAGVVDARMHDEKVRAAMKKGADRLLLLLTQQLGTTKWKRPAESFEQDKAELAMGVYALLVMYKVSGDPVLKFDSKEMTPLVAAVRGMKTNFTYGAAFQALALSQLPQRPEFKKDLEAVRDQLWSGCMEGAYTYEVPLVTRTVKKDGTEKVDVIAAKRENRVEAWDNSNGQYGLLGMWACSDAGVEVPERYWQQVDGHWRGCQLPGGDWSYTIIDKRPYPSRYGAAPSMTAAGVANLYVVMDKMDTAVHGEDYHDKAIESAMKVLDRDMTTARNRLGIDLYMAFSVERAGLASGLKRLGGADWFKEGAAALLMRQSSAGTWIYQDSAVAGTSYALLFLARGRAPTLFSKLMYPGPWGVRQRDAARVTRYLSQNAESMMNWQIVDLRGGQGEDGLSWMDDAPVMLITGHGDPKFTVPDLKRLQQFAEAGGLIFSTADDGDEVFTTAIRKYAAAMAGKRYEMRALPADHPLYALNVKVDPKDVKLWGLSNGSRELWVHSATDMGAVWQGNQTDFQKAYWDVPTNLLSYVSGREALRCRLDPLTVPRPMTAMKSGVTVGRLVYGGNDNPEPYAWQRFSRVAGGRWAADVQVVPVRPTELSTRVPVVVISGAGTVTLAKPDQKLLGEYLRGGGTVIADPAGGDLGFVKSIEALMLQVLPESSFDAVPATHEALTGKVQGGVIVAELEARHFVAWPENSGRKLGMKELKIGERPAVLLFTGDVSSGFLGTNTWGIYGWTPGSSEVLMWNALNYLKAVKGK